MASDKVQKLVEEVQKLSVMELSDLVKELQDKLGVSPVMAGPAPAPVAPQAAESDAAGAAGGGAGIQTVVLTNTGANKIAVIKALREINPNLGLKEAKDMTEKVPQEVVKDVKAEEAKQASEKLQAAGATVELK